MKYIAGNNIALTQADKNITIATNPDLISNSITTGDSKLDNSGLVITDTADSTKTVKVTDSEISAGGQQIKNVGSAGDVTDIANASNAVNAGDVNTAITNLTNKGIVVGANTNPATGAPTHKLGNQLDIVAATKDASKTYDTSNLTTEVAQDAATGKTTVTVSMKKDVDFDSVTAGTGTDKTVLNKDGLTVTEGSKVTTIGEGQVKVTNGSNTLALDADKGTLNGLTNTTWDPTKVVSGQAATEDQLKTVSAVANKGWDVTTDKTGTGTVTGTSVTNVAPGDEVKYIAGNNIALTQADKNITIATNP
ncbi:hypothetical protein U9697_24405, partial [Escherichia coli]